MIHIENPVDLVRQNAETIAQQALRTDMTNITMSQWQVELHEEPGEAPTYVVFCAINRRLDPLDKPYMLHMRASDLDHLKLMFHHVEWIAGGIN